MQNLTSRRSLLFSTVAVGLAGIAAKHCAAESETRLEYLGFGTQPSSSIVDRNGERQVHLFSPSHQDFNAILASHFPSLVHDQTFNRLKNTSVIMHHAAGPEIVACNVRWSVSLPSGPLVTEISRFARPRPSKRYRQRSCDASLERTVSKQGDLTLLSPFFSLRCNGETRAKEIDWATAAKSKALQGFLANQFTHIQATEAVVQSVIFADNSAVYMDDRKFVRRIQKRSNTELQLAKAVLQRIYKGASDRHLAGAFNKTYNTSRGYSPLPRAIIFHDARRQYARYLHQVLREQGREKLLAIVSVKASQTVMKIRRLPIASA